MHSLFKINFMRVNVNIFGGFSARTRKSMSVSLIIRGSFHREECEA